MRAALVQHPRLLHSFGVGTLLVAIALIIWQAAEWARHRGLEQLHDNARQNLELYTSHLEGELAKYAYLPAVLATAPELLRLLRSPEDAELVDQVNRLLHSVNEEAGSSDVYIMDLDGWTLAASNWQDRRNFVGQNFSFRPYFQQALGGALGRYFALGTTSLQRGYYFAYPVREQGTIAGVVAVKVGITPIEYEWAGSWGDFLVTDPDGVIFLTTRPTWKFSTLHPLDGESLQRIKSSRRYSNIELQPMPITGDRPYGEEGARLIEVVEPATASPFGDPPGRDTAVAYLMQSVAMPEADWKVHSLSRLAPVYLQMGRAALLTATAIAALMLFGMLLRQRQVIQRQRMRFEQASKEALEANEARIRAIIDSTRAGLVTLDGQGRIESLNPTAESLFGHTETAITGMPFTDLIAPRDRARCAAMPDTPRPVNPREADALRSDGGHFPVELTIDPLPASDRFLVTVHDITKIKAHESELQQARDELELRVHERTADLQASNVRLSEEIAQHRATEEALRQTQEELIQAAKLAALGQMSAGINHELNQPLTAIRTYADNARKLLDHERVEDVDSNLEQIVQLTERMAQIITLLKAFARKSSGRAVAVSLPAAIDGALRLLRVDNSPVDLVRDLPDEELFVMADMVRLEQVLVNLVGNALQAMEGRDRQRLELATQSDAGTVTLRLRDSGPGIAVEHLDKVFDPFFTTKEVGLGLGLGLSISYRIVEDFGGTLRAANHPDGGAVFTVRLPRADQLQEKSA